MGNRVLLEDNVVKDVRTILVVMSSFAVAFDRESIIQKLLLVYPDCAIFFKTTSGKTIGSPCPEKVDLHNRPYWSRTKARFILL